MQLVTCVSTCIKVRTHKAGAKSEQQPRDSWSPLLEEKHAPERTTTTKITLPANRYVLHLRDRNANKKFSNGFR